MKKNLLNSRAAILMAIFAVALAWPASGQQTGQRSGRSGGSSRTYPGAGAIGDAYFSIDPETRRVVTITDEETSKYIQEVLTSLDRPKPQVLIKVVFLEVTHNDSLDIGLEGGWASGIGNSTTGAVANAFGMSAINQAAGGLGTNAFNVFGQPIKSLNPAPPGAGLYQILGQDYQVTLRAIAEAGSAKILSKPSILARNNQPATITVGQSVPLITSVRYDNYGNAINSVTYEDVGVILKVTPFITKDNMVEMIIAPEISSLDPTTTVPISADVSVPVINVRSADTVAVTPDGQTVVIGGLMSNTKTKYTSKIPLLGDIPLLGNLFKRQQNQGSKTELLIFLTPHIVAAPTELAALSQKEQEAGFSPNSFTEEELDRFLKSLPAKEAAKKKKSKKTE